ncbi:MAG: hypothetical protein UU23_C0005G0001, partial [Candidatus Curtissbacteria bacterium GW2011_GWA1_40_9]
NSNPISDALSSHCRPISHPRYGDGLLWHIGKDKRFKEKGRMEFFPDNSLLRIRFKIGPREYEDRSYRVDRIASQSDQAILFASRGIYGVSCQVEISKEGTVTEIHHLSRLVAGNQEVKEPVQNLESYSVNEAARIIGCTTANIRKLLRNKRLPGVKTGRDWQIEARAVINYVRRR